jgi:hypothetical protein
MEKQRSNSDQSKRGVNFKGKKMGNNLSLDTAIQPDPQLKSNGWAKKRALIKAVTAWKNYAENNESTVITLEDGTEQPISGHIVPLYELHKEALKGNLKAIKLYYDITESQKSEFRNVDENGNVSHPCIVFSHPKEDLLKALLDPTIELSDSDNDRIIELIKTGATLV